MLRSLRSSFFSTSYQLLPSSSSPPESTHNDSSSSLPLPTSSSSSASSRKRTKRIVLGALAVGATVALLAGWSAGSSELGETTLAVGADESSSTGLGWSETGASGEEGSTSTGGEGATSDDISEGEAGGGEEEEEEDKDELATSPPSLSNQTSLSDHPRIQLASPLPIPSPNPLPYPSPSSACLLHLFTLPSLSSFDPLLCPPPSSPEPLDVVTTFVNGTGPLFLNAYDTALASVDIKPARRHYSNLGEMRFSLRSAARGLVGGRASRGTIRGVGSDFPVEGGVENERLGQIPHWLDWSLVSRPWDPSSPPPPSIPSPKPISWAFHSEIYLGSPEWKAGALPTFNSFAIESQLHNVPFLSPNFVSMNDDFFIVRPMTASDFHSELLGPVFKVQDDLKVTGKENARVGDEGEWAALDWAAWTLGQRHPSVNRGIEYLTHLPKTLTVPHLHEISITFKDALLASSSRKFREQKTSGPDLEIAFLATHYIRQRYREALLFSYVVARSGGTWGARERAELVALGVDGWKGRVGDGLVKRSGLEGRGVVDFLEKAGEEEMKATEISFSSFAGVHKIPFPSPRPNPLKLDQCLGSWWTSEDLEEEVDAVWMFRRIAFQDDYCGDLLLTAILNLTPEPGLTSLLPRPNSFFQPSLVDDAPTERPPIYDVPHLPLTPAWEEADFTLETLFPSWTGLPMEGVDLLDWTLRLLGRYRHTMGSSPSHFTSLRSLASVNQLSNLMKGRPEMALLAVNDDIPAYIKEEQRSRMGEQLRQWGEDRWPGKGVWELTD